MSRREPSPEEKEVLDQLPEPKPREVPDWVDQLPERTDQS